MINLNEISAEQKLIILLSRITFSEEDIKSVQLLAETNNINWFEAFKLALYHKTATLCWKNVCTIVKNPHIPKYLRDVLEIIYWGLIRKNETYQQEIARIVAKSREIGVTIMPVKGATLIPNMYKDYGVRYSGDADFLIRYEDVDSISTIVENLGYVQGVYNPLTETVEKAPRGEIIRWKAYMSNLYPYIKKADDGSNRVYKLDFRYALDDSLLKEPINEIISAYQIKGKESPEHVLIHLCTHFYDEAKHVMTIQLCKDFNLIKLCDIREYIIQFVGEDALERCISFATKYGLEEQLYYTMYFLEFIYNDGYELLVMNRLNIASEEFIHMYGKNTTSEHLKFQKSVMDRLFSCGNLDELEQ